MDQSNHENYRNIFDANPDPIAITRVSDGCIVLVNRAFVEASGYTREEALGRTAIELGLWPDPAERQRCFELLQKSGELRNVSITFQSKYGERRPFLISASAVWFNGEPCTMTATRDVTELRKIEAELVAAREAAVAASRAKSEFLSSMSHEIRTPMNAILGMAELLEDVPLAPQSRRYLEVMRENGEILMRLINDILDLARIEAGRLNLEEKDFNLRELLNSLVDTFAPRARENGLALNLRIGPGIPLTLVGDELRLRQVLVNLVGNAIKFTVSGCVEIAVSHEAAHGPDPMLHFAVIDTGIGIPADKLLDMFSAFTQADSSTARRYGGSGLGLAIVRRLVELMAGKVWAESKAGAGSTFHFTVRFRASSRMHPPGQLYGAVRNEVPIAPLADQHANHADIAPLRELKLLVVDDSPDNRFLMKAFLKPTRCRLDEACNGQEAVEKLRSDRYDLVLMDMQMPVMDGYRAVQLIREWELQHHAAHTPIVALTASALREDVENCLKAGCDFHASKPINKTMLLDVVRRATANDDPLPVPLLPHLLESSLDL